MRDRRRRLHGHLPCERPERDDDRRPRERPGRDAPRLLLGERQSAPVQRGALQRSLRGSAGNRRDVGRGAGALRHDLAGGGARPGDPGRARRIRRRSDVLRPDAGKRRLVRRHPRIGGSLPRSGRDAARCRHRLPQPGSRTHLRADRAPRGEGLLSRRGGGCARPDGSKPTRLADRQPHLASGSHDDARPPRLHRARTGAGSGRLSRARRLRDGPALERWLDGGGSAQHPRGLSALDAARARRRCTTTSKRLGTHSPTAARISRIPRTSTCR